MAQGRYYNFGGSADDDAENLINLSLHPKGVYRGMELSAPAANTLQIAAGFSMQHNGIVVAETNEQTLSFYPPATATTYTVIAEHEANDLLGGSPVVYSITDGFLDNPSVPDGIVLGWIFHPGGGVPLSNDYILDAPRQLATDYADVAASLQPIELLPAFPRAGFSNIGTNITITEGEFDTTDFLMVQTIANTASVPGVQTVDQDFVFFYDGRRVNEISLYSLFQNTAQTKIVMQVLDTSQTPVNFSDGTPTATFTGADDWETLSASVQRWGGTFEDKKPYTVRLTFHIKDGEYIKLGRFLASFNPYQ